jgi:hypothetical protein
MYRLLDEGEDILPSDQYYDTRHGWQSCAASRPHTAKVSYSSLPVRRKIEDAKELATPPNTDSPKCQHCTRGFQRLSKMVLELLRQQIDEELSLRAGA